MFEFINSSGCVDASTTQIQLRVTSVCTTLFMIIHAVLVDQSRLESISTMYIINNRGPSTEKVN